MRRLLVALVLAAGCTPVQNANVLPMVAITEVPMVARNAAAAQRPDVRFHTAFKSPDGNFQLRGKDRRGRTIACDVTPAGNVLRLFYL